ncbi:hypothetical protein A0257_12320 [Hymenobacter psoromatis]|nr:hypothetical protein A0257_12320 [Hymenobacter psoromatis]
MQPYVPYAWQKKGVTQRRFARRNNKRLNVFGLLSLAGQLTVYHQEKPLDSLFIREALADFASRPHPKPYVIILDNGSIHHAQVIKEELEKWEEADFFIFYLPTYSPHLNPIEILWRFCKYTWLTKVNYKTWGTLKKAILSIFKQYGGVYNINFSELIIKNTNNLLLLNSA